MSCTSTDHDKTPAMFQKDPAMFVGGVAFSRYPVSICFSRSQAKNGYVQTAKKVTKINLRIATKCHVHPQTLIKIPEKFQNGLAKIVGRVAFTRLDTICDVQSDGQRAHELKQCLHTLTM